MDIEIKSNIVSEQDAVEILTQMKIDYDKTRMQLIDYKLDDLISEHGKLK